MIKTTVKTVFVVLTMIGMAGAQARDDRLKFPIKAAMDTGKSTRTALDPSIRLYFGQQKTPAVAKTMGEWTSNKKTNAANKSDQEACEIAFVSAALSLQDRAKKEGGNAVINIRSVYKNDNVESASEYLCGAGTFMAGVALRGTVVTLKK
jgi:uncharacterized protein YbjQ (UPF0145 family)